MRVPIHTALAAVLAAVLLPAPATAFNKMQIEQVSAGANGAVDRQAIQLRMREAGQGAVTFARLVAWDAQGENPVVVGSFDANAASTSAGDRVLLATARFDAGLDLLPDYLMQQPIPEGYLDAGRLTYETLGGLVYWSLCWGGAAYTGGSSGTTTNDSDGEFGPCHPGPLPTASRDALAFTGAAADASTDNASDYATTADPAVFTNNSGESAEVSNVVVFADGMDR